MKLRFIVFSLLGSISAMSAPKEPVQTQTQSQLSKPKSDPQSEDGAYFRCPDHQMMVQIRGHFDQKGLTGIGFRCANIVLLADAKNPPGHVQGTDLMTGQVERQSLGNSKDTISEIIGSTKGQLTELPYERYGIRKINIKYSQDKKHVEDIGYSGLTVGKKDPKMGEFEAGMDKNGCPLVGCKIITDKVTKVVTDLEFRSSCDNNHPKSTNSNTNTNSNLQVKSVKS